MNTTKKLEDDTIWQLANKVAIYIYLVLERHKQDIQYPADFKLKESAFNLPTCIAAGLGSIDPRDKTWSFGKARSALYELKSSYRSLHDMKIVSIDPDVMVEIEEVGRLLDNEIAAERTNIPKWFAEMNSPQGVTV